MVRLRDFAALFGWLEKKVLPTVYPYRDYNGKLLTKYQRNFHGNMYARRIGPAVLRQVRVKTSTFISFIIPHVKILDSDWSRAMD